MSGWIKLHRSCLNHWLYKSKKPRTRREAWEDMLLIVNFEPKKTLIRGQLYTCDRGQSLLSLDSWAKEFNWTVQQVRTFFKLLENDKMITIEGMQYTTRLTICNYDIYQQSVTDEQHTEQQTANRPLTDRQQTANKPLTTTKEREEIKEEKNKRINIYFENFRLKYPGIKRGYETEFSNFIKKHQDWNDIVSQLEQIIDNQIKYREILKSKNQFVPAWKNMQTWINQRCWEESTEIKTDTELTKEQKKEQILKELRNDKDSY